MDEILLYTLPTCGKCKILKQKLKAKDIPFTEISDENSLMNAGFDVVPVMCVNNHIYNFTEANTWVNQQGE